jgi:hypothetical protein
MRPLVMQPHAAFHPNSSAMPSSERFGGDPA